MRRKARDSVLIGCSCGGEPNISWQYLLYTCTPYHPRLRPRPEPGQVPEASPARHARGQAFAKAKREKGKGKGKDKGKGYQSVN